MYPLHEMDHGYIVESIRLNIYLTKEYKEILVKHVNTETSLLQYEKDYIILSLKYNGDLSPAYKEILIFKIKEG